jgi:hypothetical protein
LIKALTKRSRDCGILTYLNKKPFHVKPEYDPPPLKAMVDKSQDMKLKGELINSVQEPRRPSLSIELLQNIP